MITKEKKGVMLSEIEKRVNDSKIMIFTYFNELPVSEIAPLRRELKTKKGEFKVFKNTLVKKVLEKKGIKIKTEILEGPTGVVFGYEDPFRIVKLISDYQRTHRKNFNIKGGIFGESTLTSDDLSSLSSITSIEEVYGKLAYSLKSPVVRMVFALKSPIARLINVLNEIKSKKE
ncbi:MAG: 50S ribosomal protein L10 [Caldisericia bacterium]